MSNLIFIDCLLNSSQLFIRLLSELLKLIGCQGNINDKYSKRLLLKTVYRMKVQLCNVFSISV